jgi:hypothetical protein
MVAAVSQQQGLIFHNIPVSVFNPDLTRYSLDNIGTHDSFDARERIMCDASLY